MTLPNTTRYAFPSEAEFPATATNQQLQIAVDLKDIRKIVELMNEHELSYFHLEKEEFNIKLKKGLDADAVSAAMASSLSNAATPQPAPVATPIPSTAPAQADETQAAPSGDPIDSPMVGTFYRKPTPESPDFVTVGDTISEGQTLCIIEAMKVMNEIKAERSGTIASILVDDATPVQFGDTLFTIK